MRYYLIDKVTKLKRSERISAVKNVALSEDIFSEHFVGFPVMPGALIIEAFAQAGTALLEYSSDFTKKAVLALVKEMKFRKVVYPGDRMEIDAEVVGLSDAHAELTCHVRVEGIMVADGMIVFSLRDIDEFYPPKYRAAVELLYSVWMRDAVVE